MKLAVIDCGTNTFNLIIVQVTAPHKFVKLYHTRVPVKLGEGTINGGYIDQKPFLRGLEALRAFSQKIREENADKVLAFATSAIRDGKNGPEFVKAALDEFGINIRTIDGNEEAELVYQAVREAVKLGEEVALIMDIGGGSVEFLLANNNDILWKQSFKIGAARLLEMFSPGDRITAAEQLALRDYLHRELKPLREAAEKYRPVELVGSSGAFESFVEMIHGELGGEELTEDKTGFDINLQQYRKISATVIGSSLAERQQLKGLIPMRVDMIVICCIMVDYVLDQFRLKKMRMSVWSLKEGAMVNFVKAYHE